MRQVDTCSLQLWKAVLEKVAGKSPSETEEGDADWGHTRKQITIFTHKEGIELCRSVMKKLCEDCLYYMLCWEVSG